MTATLHKIMAGNGFKYYLERVAAHDSTGKNTLPLADYYSSRGESPGVWRGSGLAALGITEGSQVAESQFRALVGEGRHPDTQAIEARIIAEQTAAGVPLAAAEHAAKQASRLGSPFRSIEADNVFRRRCAQAFSAHNLARGLSARAPVPEDVRAGIRTGVAREMFIAELGRPPTDVRELSGWVARHSRPQAAASVAAFDLHVAPVGSAQTLYAVGRAPLSRKVVAAHEAAVADVVRFLEEHAAYTRLGRNGVRQVDTTGLIIAEFFHRESRAGDPDPHSHLVISAKVRTVDGQWRALDARHLYRLVVTASEIYNTSHQLHLQQSAGLEYVERPARNTGKRPTYEIVGVDTRLTDFWSSRGQAIIDRGGELATRFQREHGREPNQREMYDLLELANLQTRQPKHEPRSFAEQRAQWLGEAITPLCGTVGLEQMLFAIDHPKHARRPKFDNIWIAQAADAVVDRVSADRAVWQAHHIRSEAERHVRGAQLPLADRDRVVASIVAAALAPSRSIERGDPDQVEGQPEIMLRRDGSSVYTTPGAQQYTSAKILAAEQRLIRAAQQPGGRILSQTTISTAISDHARRDPHRKLNADQEELVHGFAGSGLKFQLNIAPAGAGKTTAVRVLADAWREDGGNVIGFAPNAAAARVLEQETGAPAHTLHLLTTTLERARGTRSVDAAAVPRWVSSVGPHTLVIIDEIAQSGTLTLDHAVSFLLNRGATIRGIGDHEQLASPEAGGVVRDIVAAADTLSMSRLVRFADPTEGWASLAIRDGNPSAIGYYIDHGRVHVGAAATVIEDAYLAWTADLAAGRDAVMLGPTHEFVARLNMRARADRLASHRPTGREIALSDGLLASVGDTIRTRENDRRIPLSRTDYVRNGYRWTIRKIHSNGGLTVTHIGTGRKVFLPIDYVRHHVTLGYAATIDSAQGITTHVCHSVFAGTETRPQLYTAITRGSLANHVYLGTALDPVETAPWSDSAAIPQTGVEFLSRVLGREGTQKSATTILRETADPRQRLGRDAEAYGDALELSCEQHVGPDTLTELDRTADHLHPGLTESPAYHVLRQHLIMLAVHGKDPTATLRTAVERGELHSARDPAAVLDHRLDTSGTHSARPGPLPWLPAVPDRLASDPRYGPTLSARAQNVTAQADEVARVARSWVPSTAPQWARPFTGDENAPLVADLAVWRAVHHVDDRELLPTGPERHITIERHHQQRLDARVRRAIGKVDHPVNTWGPMVRQMDQRIVADPHWPRLAEQIAAAHRAGVDIEQLLQAVAAERPLPDEMPAAALSWRIASQTGDESLLSPITMPPTPNGEVGLTRLTANELDQHILRLRQQLTIATNAGTTGTERHAQRPRTTDESVYEAIQAIRHARSTRAAETATATTLAALHAEIARLREQLKAVPLARWRTRSALQLSIVETTASERELTSQRSRETRSATEAERDAIRLAGPPSRWSSVDHLSATGNTAQDSVSADDDTVARLKRQLATAEAEIAQRNRTMSSEPSSGPSQPQVHHRAPGYEVPDVAHRSGYETAP